MIIHAYDNWDRHFAHLFYRYFSRHIKVELADKALFMATASKSKTLEHSVIIETERRQYIIVDHYDWNDIDCYKLLDDDRVVALLKCQYRKEGYSHPKILPYTYLVRDPEQFYPLLGQVQRSADKEPVYFQGNLRYGRKAILQGLSASLNADWQQKSKLPEYVNRLCNARWALSIPGHGNFCHREIEAFAAGTAVLMPEHENRFYDELIPGLHYKTFDLEKDDIATAIAEKPSRWMIQAAKEWHSANVLRAAELAERILGEKMNYAIV